MPDKDYMRRAERMLPSIVEPAEKVRAPRGDRCGARDRIIKSGRHFLATCDLMMGHTGNHYDTRNEQEFGPFPR